MLAGTSVVFRWAIHQPNPISQEDPMTESSSLLNRRAFGSTGFVVPAIAVGCAPLGNMPDTFAYGVSEADAVATVRAALQSPFNYIDTAAWYGDGESERRIGIVLRELGGLPHGAFLQTKIGSGPAGEDGKRVFSADVIERRFYRSLELLAMDRFDMVFLHDPEHATDEEIFGSGGALEKLQSLQSQGLIGHLGVAGGPIDLEIRYVETGVFDAVITHNRYTLLNRVADPLLTLAAEKQLAVLNAAPYGSGMLAKGPAAYPRYAYRETDAKTLQRATELETICQRHGVPLAAAALQFSMRDPRITATIVGMSRPERLQQTEDLANTVIPDALWDEIADVPFDMSEPE
jgi:D-threo-aldose 1-dehydrogenase